MQHRAPPMQNNVTLWLDALNHVKLYCDALEPSETPCWTDYRTPHSRVNSNISGIKSSKIWLARSNVAQYMVPRMVGP